MKFYVTIEMLEGQRAAIVALTDSCGEFAGAGRVETRCGSACGHSVTESLYEIGYRYASLTAQSKGGRVESYRVVQ